MFHVHYQGIYSVLWRCRVCLFLLILLLLNTNLWILYIYRHSVCFMCLMAKVNCWSFSLLLFFNLCVSLGLWAKLHKMCCNLIVFPLWGNIYQCLGVTCFFLQDHCWQGSGNKMECWVLKPRKAPYLLY